MGYAVVTEVLRPMLIRVNDESFVEDLCAHFTRSGFTVESAGGSMIQVYRRDTLSTDQERREIELHLRVWQASIRLSASIWSLNRDAYRAAARTTAHPPVARGLPPEQPGCIGWMRGTPSCASGTRLAKRSAPEDNRSGCSDATCAEEGSYRYERGSVPRAISDSSGCLRTTRNRSACVTTSSISGISCPGTTTNCIPSARTCSYSRRVRVTF